MTERNDNDEQRRPFCVVGQACSGPDWQARITELEGSVLELLRLVTNYEALIDSRLKEQEAAFFAALKNVIDDVAK